MKHLILIPLLALIILSPLAAGSNLGLPLAFSDSYMMRAKGSEANYWNPALLQKSGDIWFPAVNSGVIVTNNAISIDHYNSIMKSRFISPADKEKLLDGMKDSFVVSLSGQSSIVGFSIEDVAFSSSIHYHAKLALSRKYLELLLYGNKEEEYLFSKKDTYVASLAFVDITVGKGGIRLPLPESIPDILVGASGSLLIGIEELHTSKYEGLLRANMDGLTLDQDLTLLSGGGGIGFKGMVGLASEPVKNLHAGITLDNIFGGIRWGLVSQKHHYEASADSVYLANLDEDLLDYDSYTEKAGNYKTDLPLELRLGLLYKLNKGSLSVDYLQGFGDSPLTSKTGRVNFGVELLPLPSIPLRFGYTPGTSSHPWRAAYGVSLRIKPFDLGLGVQSYGNLIPGSSSKGMGISLNLKTIY